jgi:hypothetical protein
VKSNKEFIKLVGWFLLILIVVVVCALLESRLYWVKQEWLVTSSSDFNSSNSSN